MTKNKDQKRLVRARMKKTGEAYTTARAVVAARGQRTRRTEDDATIADYAARAGTRDEAVEEKTGCGWAEWVRRLDEADATKLSHREISRHISATYPDVPGWWVQTVTVGYERIRGLRDVGQQRSGEYEANKSRTFAASASDLYRFVRDARWRARWFGTGVLRIRASVENRSVRMDLQDGTRAHFYIVEKSDAKASLAVQQTKLTTREDVDAAKIVRGERFDALRALIAARPVGKRSA